ncbi:MAG: GYF domain-containing protein [Verrucomicrobiota bacterium]
MYKIIGADGREYGPISSDQLRQWIAEGRANAHTRVQAEGATEWKSLAEMPEFAAIYNVPPPIPQPLPIGSKPAGADKKIAAGICGIILGGLGVHKFILGYTGEGVTMLLISILTCFIGYPIMHLFGIIEGIIYLAKSDENFVATYVSGKKGWF